MTHPGHQIVKCSQCNRIIRQCRCMGTNKPTVYEYCGCNQKNLTVEEIEEGTKELSKIKYWNHRIVEHKDKNETWYGLHEVFYDKNNKAVSMTKDPVKFTGNDPFDLVQGLYAAYQDAIKKEIFYPPEEWDENN